MRTIISFAILQLSISLSAQRLIDRTGQVIFFSETPVENIEAQTNQALAALDLATGKVAVSILMKSFKFEKSLMQEHFNENYIESDKYPKATYTGQISDFESQKLPESSDTTKMEISGKLTIHGIEQPHECSVYFWRQNEFLHARAIFSVRIEDHDIEIPKVVVMNIAEEVKITAQFKFSVNE